MRATSVEDIYKIFDTHKYLTEKNKEFFVDLYSEDLKELKFELLLNEIPSKTFYIAGQSGNGKSTALHFLPIKNPEIEDKFFIKYLEVEEYLNFEEVDIIDVLIMLGLVVIEDDEELEKEFLEKLTQLQDLKLGNLAKEENQQEKNLGGYESSVFTKFSLPLLGLFNTGADLKAKYSIESETRTAVRKIFKADKRELIEIVNEAIRKFLIKNSKNNLLIILDGLEKKEDIDHVFEKDGNIFDLIQCNKIISMPFYLVGKTAFTNKTIHSFSIKITPNPTIENCSVDFLGNKEKLREVILKRVVEEYKELISDEAIEEVVKKSAGNLRQLISIIQRSAILAIKSERESIILEDINDAVGKFSSQHSISFPGRQKVLKEIKENHQPSDDNCEAFKKAVKDNLIFCYLNAKAWYSVNPVIEESIN